MTHPPVEILIQHALGMDTIEANHIAECPECLGEVEELSVICATRPSREMPAALAELSSRFDEEKSAARALLDRLGPAEIRDAMLSRDELSTDGGMQALIESIPSIRRKDPARALGISQELIVGLEAGITGPDTRGLRAEMHSDALREAAACARVLGRYDDALGYLEDSETLASELPAGDYLLGRIWYERAGIEVSREGEGAREWAARAAEVFARFGDNRRHNRSRYLVAISHYNDRNYRRTIEDLNELLLLLEADDDRETQAAAWSVLGHSLLRDDSAEEARDAFSQAIAAYERLDRPIDRLRSSWGLARAELKLGSPVHSLSVLEGLTVNFRRVHLDEESALVGLDITEACLLLGDHDRALAVCRESMQTLNDRFAGREQKRALAYLAELAGTRMDVDDVRHVSAFLFDSVSHPDLPFSHPHP